jgi:hypothetical protein
MVVFLRASRSIGEALLLVMLASLLPDCSHGLQTHADAPKMQRYDPGISIGLTNSQGNYLCPLVRVSQRDDLPAPPIDQPESKRVDHVDGVIGPSPGSSCIGQDGSRKILLG